MQRAGVVGRVMTGQRITFVFFFISGIPALIYQLLWQRALFRLFGVDMASVTVVVTAFMLGLGFGALLGSWLSLRSRRYPLLLLALMEAIVGLFGLWSLDILNVVGNLADGMSLPVQALVATGVLLLPTALMGATLPLLIGHAVRRSASVGDATGYLYYLNTLGAMAGCILSALVLFPLLGMQGAIHVAVALNGMAALCALTAFLTEKPAAETAQVGTLADVAGSPHLPYGAGLCLALLGGYISLSYEIFCFHLISFATGTNALAFAMTLAAFLLGIASGARTASDLCKKSLATRTMASKALRTILYAGLFSLALLPLISCMKPVVGASLPLIIIFTFVIARAFGLLFPIVASLSVPSDQRAGSRVGLLYVANIIGSALGSTITGFYVTDLLGLSGLAGLLALSSLTIALVLAGAVGKTFRGDRHWIMIGAGLAVGAVLLFVQPASTIVTNSLLNLGAGVGPEGTRSPVVKAVENRNGIIAVNAAGQVFGGGAYDGAFNIDPIHDINGIVRPYGLSLYHPAPRDVLMIGLSSGSWAQVVANDPAVERLTIIEINPGYLDLIRHTTAVASILTNPKVQIVVDDGRRWLRRHTADKFDAILANTTIHFRANATNLLSAEFNDLIRAHLKEGGIYFFNTTSSLRVQKTACQSFRHGYRFLNHILVSDQPIMLDVDRWSSTLSAYKIDGKPVFHLEQAADRAALQTILGIPGDLTANDIPAEKKRMESCTSVLSRSPDIVPVTDDNMGTEWRYPLRMD